MRLLICFLLLFKVCYAAVWQVGPTKTYKYCSQVAPLVQHGDTIQIDYATYLNDTQVLWKKNNLLIIGIGGRPRIEAGSIIATDNVNGKGIFVISGSNVRVENIDFANATVKDHNGSGIRQEGANLHVYKCRFEGNEMGILCGDIDNCKTIVEYSEFLNGGSPANPGYQHNIYINHIDTFIFRYNYSYNALAEGHELKSRAKNTYILYNTLAQYTTIDSRNIDIPNGGTTIIMGNIIEQNQNSANSNMVGYGKEGLTNASLHELYIVNNTFVNKKTTGSFIDINNNTAKLFFKNNILTGAKTGGLLIGTAFIIDSSNNLILDNIAQCNFIDENTYNYQLKAASPAVNKGAAISTSVAGYLLVPDKAYIDRCNFQTRTMQNTIDIGAYEYNSPSSSIQSSNEHTISFSPSPTKGNITIKGMDQAESNRMEVYNHLGLLVGQYPLKENSCDLSALPNGLYFVQINKQTTALQKLIIEH